MDLKNLLSELGYNDEQIESIANKKKIYFQNDVDTIVQKKERSLLEKYEKNFIPKSEFDLLQSEYNNLNKNIKEKEIKQHFLDNGGNEKYFDDYLKLNPQLMDLDSDMLKDSINQSTQKNQWAFGIQQTNTPFGYKDNIKSVDETTFDGQTIYGKVWD